MTVEEALKVLQKALREDGKEPGSYYYSWQANIAVCIQDVWNEKKPFVNMYEISNEGAKRFLDLLLRE